LEELPLLVNGKVDRQQLAVLAEAGQQQQAAGPARPEPLSPVEQILAGIWREVLGVKEVGRDDNFFDLGGHSLLATQLLSRVRKTFEIDLALLKLYESSTLASLAQTVATELRKGTQSLQAPPIVKRKSDGELLLSFAQQRLWFIDQLESNNTAYNTPAALRLTGRLNVAALRQAMGVVVQRHEVLRTSFHMFEGRPVQVIASPAPLPMLFSDLSYLTEAEREGEVRRLALMEAWRPFDLTQAPLLRLSLIRISAEEHLFVVVMHHIVADGWSMAVLISEVESLYKAFVEGEAVTLPELPVQYADYSVWQREWLQGEVLEEQLNYWRNQLAGAPEELGLPTDKPRPAVTSYRGSHQDLTIPAELTQQLRDLSRREGVTLFMVLLAVFQVLLSRYSGEEDVCVGSPIAGRNQLETEGLIGFFVNTLVLRTRIQPHDTFRGLLQQVRKTCLSAYEHQELPFERLVEELQPERDLGRAPVVQVMFNLLNVKRATVKQSVNLPGVSWTPAGLGSETAKVDLDVSVAETEEGLRITLGYSTDLYEGNTIEQMGRYFASLLEAAAADPTQQLSALVSNVPKQKLSIAIASTFTADPVQESLSFCLRALNIPNKIELAAYDQVFQQLLDPSSTLRRNEDGTNIILLRVEDWLQDLRRNVEEFCSSLAAAAKETTATYLIGVCPSADPQSAAAVLELQTSLTANLQTQRGVSLIDLSDVATKYKIAEIYNPYTDNLAHIPFTEEFFAALGAVLARRIYNSLSSPYKVVVLDCDNTLWGGVCGEEGPQGIQLDHGFQSLQQFMARQFGAGRLLALCSKNNEDDVMQVFQNRREMTLQLHQFTAWKINWALKSQNLRALSSELQLPLDSFIFIDDDVVECAEVRADCPDVLTLQLPKNAADYPEFLEHVWAFDQLNVTEADKQRSTVYQQNRERERFQSEYPTLEQFLNDLKLEIRIARATSDQLERVAQLSQRTNQFNATVIRRTTREIEHLLETESTECWVVEVSDRFGDYGLVGAMIFDVADSVLTVDSFLLSCRALGRKVEDNMLIELLRIARERKCREVQLAFRRTAKNVPAYNFFSRIATSESDANPTFVFDVERILDSSTLAQSNYGSHFAGEVSPAPQADSLTISETTSLLSLRGPAKSELMNRIAAEFQTGSAIFTAMRAGQKRAPSRRSEEYVAPRTGTEEVVAEIWAEVLGVEKVGVKDNFFALGGHSLMATQLLSRIREVFRVDLPLRTMFATPTVLGLVDALTLAYGESNTLEDIAQLVKQLREMSEEDLSAMLTTA
jgi:FkbH-like protein